MLEAFRNAAKGWAAKILLSLLVLAFAAWGITDVFKGFQQQDLATIGDIRISGEQFRRELNKDLQQLQQQTGTAVSIEDARRLGLDQQVFDRMVNTAAIDAKAKALKLSIADQYIVDEVATNKAFQNSKGEFDPGALRAALAQAGLDEATFLASERQNRLRAALSQAVVQGAPLPRTMTEALLRYKDELRDGRYFSFTVNEADVPAPTDADLKAQYDNVPAAYTAPEYRSVAVIKVEPSDIAAKLEIAEAEMSGAYEKYKSDYFTPEKRTILQLSFPDVAAAEAAKKRIDGGEDFMKIAGELKAKETDITFADKTKGDFLDTTIGDAAFALAEGAVSAPVKGALNTVLLKAAKVSPEHQQTLVEVQDVLKKRLQIEKAKEEIQSIYDAVEDARAQQTAFEDIASKAGLPFTLVPAISAAGVDKTGADVALPSKPEVLKAAFESDVGVENDALSTQDGYIWYEVREVIPSALRPLDEVKDQVKADYVAAKLRNLAETTAKDMVAKAGSTVKLDALATERGATIKTVTGMRRNETSDAFDGPAALALFAAPANSLTWSVEGDGKSARIIEVTRVVPPAFDPASAEAKGIADTERPNLGNDAFDVLLKEIRAAANVEVNDQLWQDIRGTAAKQN